MSEWIKCSDVINDSDDALVYCSDTQEQFVGFHVGGGEFQFFDMHGVVGTCRPTHWMPLPEPPKD